jgi:polyphosphate kinase
VQAKLPPHCNDRDSDRQNQLIGHLMDDAQATVLEEKIEAPATVPLAEIGPDRFINRELSWLHFNRRVLE